MIGPSLSTIRHYGQDQERNWTINLPTSLLRELRAKGENFEHLDKVRTWLLASGKSGSSSLYYFS